MSILLVNWFYQKLLRLNGSTPWPVHFTSRVTSPEKILIGRGVSVAFAVSGGCYIQGLNGIEIGDDTIFAPGVKIISANHSARNLAEHEETKPVRIGNSCWIGANAVILPGISVGNNCIIAAGAVVTRDVKDGETVAGVPAKPITASIVTTKEGVA